MATPTDASDELKKIEAMIDNSSTKGSTPIPIGKGNKSSIEGWSSDTKQTPTTVGFEVSSPVPGRSVSSTSSSLENNNNEIEPTMKGVEDKGGLATSSATPPISGGAQKKTKEKKAPPPGFVKPPKPKLTKAERRAIQEKQREDKKTALVAAGKLPVSAAPPSSSFSNSKHAVTSPSKLPSTSPATTKLMVTAGTSSQQEELGGDVPKSKGGGGAGGGGGQTKSTAPMHMQFDDEKKRARAVKKKIVRMEPAKKQVTLFSHLPQYEKEISVSASVGFNRGEIHSAILRVGLKYADGAITGSNARCVAMLTAFKQVIEDYVTPPSKSLHRDLETRIKPMIQFLIDCRPLSISMGNAINHLKQQIISTAHMSEPEAKAFLVESIDSFIQERIILADKLIAHYACAKINHGDVILTHASSRVVEEALKRAHDEGKKFRVVVVDSRPLLEGRSLLNRLVEHGLECTYILINAISYIMKEVSKVFIGAYTLLANGNVISRAGTAVVAMMAHAQNVPVIVCCETYKFCERVQLDSICFNELGNPNDLILSSYPSAASSLSSPPFSSSSFSAAAGPSIGGGSLGGVEDPLRAWKSVDNLKLLNLLYDLTPMHFVMLVITEVGTIPPTSVPVVLREYRKEPSMT